MKRTYLVTVDVDPVPGWNDSTRPDDMRRNIQSLMEGSVKHYNPAVTYTGIISDSVDNIRRTIMACGDMPADDIKDCLPLLNAIHKILNP